MTATCGPPARSSSGVNVRPTSAGIPKTVKKRAATRRPASRAGSSPLVSVTFSAYQPDRPANVVDARFQSSRRAGAMRAVGWRFDGFASITLTRRSGSGNGKGLIRTVSTTENTAVVVAMPSARVKVATRANAGRRASDRAASRYRFMDECLRQLDGGERALDGRLESAARFGV